MAEFKQAVAYTHQFSMTLTAGGPATGKSPVVKIGKAGSAGVTAHNSPATEVDATNLPGVYSLVLDPANDVNTGGSFALVATAASCNQTTEFHQVRFQIITDLNIDGNGNIRVVSNIKQGQPLNVFFTMTVNGAPTPGLTVTGTRNFGSGFSPVSGPITSLGNGTYLFAALGPDTNGPSGLWRFIATGADDRDISFVTTP